MKIDLEQTRFHEASHKPGEFTREELKKARILLRRLRFLEQKVRETGGLSDGAASGGAAFAEWEQDALEWALVELGFLPDESKD